jgi:hypothetical protein
MTNLPKRSPWGKVQSAVVKIPGIVEVSCAGHGGVKVDPKLNKKIPECVRQRGGWYEEDVEWAIVAVVFPEAYPNAQSEARNAIRDYYPEVCYPLTGEFPTVENSRQLRRLAFYQETQDKYVVISASGPSSFHPDIPQGAVKVWAVKRSTREEKRFLLKAEDYKQGEFGYVVPENAYEV